MDLGKHHVDAFVAVRRGWGAVKVGGDAREHVGIVAREVFFGDEKINHFADGEFGAFGEIFR